MLNIFNKYYVPNSNANIINKYYKQSSIIASKFDKFLQYIINMIKFLKTKNFDSYYIELNKFNTYRRTNISYLDIKELKLISQLIDIITNFVTTIDSMISQITSLEIRLSQKCKDEMYTSLHNAKVIKQDTGLKLEYLQYLLLFDINESNGLFIETYLNVARNLLISNNNNLVRNF